MKIVLDLDRLLADQQISADEYARLSSFAEKETGSLAFNILVGFGVIATAAGALALMPNPWTALVLGLILATAGAAISFNLAKEWGLLGSILVLVGAVTATGGVLALTEGGLIGFLIATVIYSVAAIATKSALLSVLATLSLSGTVGAMTAYGHATYTLVIRQPSLTIVVFAILALTAYHLSNRLAPDYQRIAIMVARTSLFLVNLGFWVGSLWGDSIWLQRESWDFRSGALVPDWVFVIGWAVGILITGAWAARANKRWVVNLLAVFGAIHLYTQYFERLGASPGSILIAGLLTIGIAIGFVWYNKTGTLDDMAESRSTPQRDRS